MQYWQHKKVISSAICLQPTPIVMGDFIRVYAGYFPMIETIGHVGFFDYNPTTNQISNETFSALMPGAPGMFDSFGVVPTCIVVDPYGERTNYWMYYAGYQQLKDVRFCAFGGLAVSSDGIKFTRNSDTPVCDRIYNNSLFHVIHWALHDVYPMGHAWIGGGGSFRQGRNKTLPIYNIQYCETYHLEPNYDTERTVVDTRGAEHRVGRPTVIYQDGKYRMWYCYGEETTFGIGYAESEEPGDGFVRMDDQVTFEYPTAMRAYPAVVEFEGKLLMFYNIAYGQALISDPVIMVAQL